MNAIIESCSHSLRTLFGSDCPPRIRGLCRWFVVILGIIAIQFAIHGSSLTGRNILLPLRDLGVLYMPASKTELPRADTHRFDLTLQFEPFRRFAGGEIQSGRWPTWSPMAYCGAPFIWPKYSPFYLFQLLTPSPRILAWAEMMVALVASTGMYFFLRRCFRLRHSPAAVGCWLFPLTGYFVLWSGFQIPPIIALFPWSLAAVHETIQKRAYSAPVWLAIVTALILLCSHLDIGGQVLLASGVYALWRLWLVNRKRLWSARMRNAILGLLFGWMVGGMLGAPQVLPTLEYLQSSSRMQDRSKGYEARKPGSLRNAMEVVLPHIYGSPRVGSYRYGDAIFMESAAGGYAGLIPALFLAPLAFMARSRRLPSIFFFGLALAGIVWCIGVPYIVDILRSPGLRMISHNRWVFLTSTFITVLAAFGLDAVRRGYISGRIWILPCACLVSILGWSYWRSENPPAAIFNDLPIAMARGSTSVRNMDDVRNIVTWFREADITHGSIAFAGLIFWFWWTRRREYGYRVFFAASFISILEVGMFASTHTDECDPSMYYPRLPALVKISQENKARMIGVNCLPPQYSFLLNLSDVRGYDGVDPSDIVELVTATNRGGVALPYAKTLTMVPDVQIDGSGGVTAHPILSLLNVRYCVFRGNPPSGVVPLADKDGYFVMENTSALPRMFVPKRLETVGGRQERLKRMTSPDFNPAEIAFTESPLLPPEHRAEGTANIVSETPTEILAVASMKTRGLLVLADNWDRGWRAFVNGTQTPIHRVDHALRGVVLPEGNTNLVFRYEPASVRLGHWLALAGIFCIAGRYLITARLIRK